MVRGYYVTRLRQTRSITLQCMRIAVFCHKFWPAVGGLCTYAGRLTEYLVAHGHDVRVFTAKSPPDSASCEQIAPGLVVRRFTTSFGSQIGRASCRERV